MAKVHVKITPSLAGALNTSGTKWIVLEKDISEHSTIGDLFTDIALTDKEFRKVIFDPDSEKINDMVVVAVNGKLLQAPKITEYILNNKDVVVLLPVYMGG